MTSERTLENQARYLKNVFVNLFWKMKEDFFIYYLLYLYVVYSSFKNNQLRMNQLTVILNWFVKEHYFFLSLNIVSLDNCKVYSYLYMYVIS